MPPLVLAIDNDSTLLELYQDVLSEEGYRLVRAERPYDDAGDVERINPDVIILNYLFDHEVLGLQFLDTLRKHPATAASPILLCSGAANVEEQLQGYLNQTTRLLLKPFSIDELLATLAELLDARERARS